MNQTSPQKTAVPAVQMEELFINGITQLEETQVKNPLNTDRFIAKFKGKQPIMTNGPNFLNRKKQGMTKTEAGSDPTLNLLG